MIESTESGDWIDGGSEGERDVTDSLQVVITGNLVQRWCLFTEVGN